MQWILVLIADALTGIYIATLNTNLFLMIFLQNMTNVKRSLRMPLQTTPSSRTLLYCGRYNLGCHIERTKYLPISALQTQDEFLQLKAAQLLTVLLRWAILLLIKESCF